MYKIYLVTFTIEGKKALKIGITSKTDVQERFQRLIDNGTITGFKIHLTRWIDGEEAAKLKEQHCFTSMILSFPKNNYIDKDGSHKFHNFWLKEQVGGVTEIRKYDHQEYLHAYKLVDKSGFRFYNDAIRKKVLHS